MHDSPCRKGSVSLNFSTIPVSDGYGILYLFFSDGD